MGRGFTPDDAKEFYDRFGSKQDLQACYENKAVKDLVAHAAFEQARAVFELGFGTGRFARRLFERHLPPDAAYFGIDISTGMVRLAEERLRPWRHRAAVTAGDATKGIGRPDGSFDRFVSIYVFDLMSPEDIRAVLDEAYRVLKPGGLICVVSLTRGRSAWGRFVTRAWERLYRKDPRLVGGCRPINVFDYLPAGTWELNYQGRTTSLGIASQIFVAKRKR